MSKINREEVYAIIGIIFSAVFVSFLSWQVLVVNHSRNVDRDKFYAEHCSTVAKQAGLFGTYYTCKDNRETK